MARWAQRRSATGSAIVIDDDDEEDLPAHEEQQQQHRQKEGGGVPIAGLGTWEQRQRRPGETWEEAPTGARETGLHSNQAQPVMRQQAPQPPLDRPGIGVAGAEGGAGAGAGGDDSGGGAEWPVGWRPLFGPGAPGVCEEDMEVDDLMDVPLWERARKGPGAGAAAGGTGGLEAAGGSEAHAQPQGDAHGLQMAARVAGGVRRAGSVLTPASAGAPWRYGDVDMGAEVPGGGDEYGGEGHAVVSGQEGTAAPTMKDGIPAACGGGANAEAGTAAAAAAAPAAAAAAGTQRDAASPKEEHIAWVEEQVHPAAKDAAGGCLLLSQALRSALQHLLAPCLATTTGSTEARHAGAGVDAAAAAAGAAANTPLPDLDALMSPISDQEVRQLAAAAGGHPLARLALAYRPCHVSARAVAAPGSAEGVGCGGEQLQQGGGGVSRPWWMLRSAAEAAKRRLAGVDHEGCVGRDTEADGAGWGTAWDQQQHHAACQQHHHEPLAADEDAAGGGDGSGNEDAGFDPDHIFMTLDDLPLVVRQPTPAAAGPPSRPPPAPTGAKHKSRPPTSQPPPPASGLQPGSTGTAASAAAAVLPAVGALPHSTAHGIIPNQNGADDDLAAGDVYPSVHNNDHGFDPDHIVMTLDDQPLIRRRSSVPQLPTLPAQGAQHQQHQQQRPQHQGHHHKSVSGPGAVAQRGHGREHGYEGPAWSGVDGGPGAALEDVPLMQRRRLSAAAAPDAGGHSAGTGHAGQAPPHGGSVGKEGSGAAGPGGGENTIPHGGTLHPPPWSTTVAATAGQEGYPQHEGRIAGGPIQGEAGQDKLWEHAAQRQGPPGREPQGWGEPAHQDLQAPRWDWGHPAGVSAVPSAQEQVQGASHALQQAWEPQHQQQQVASVGFAPRALPTQAPPGMSSTAAPWQGQVSWWLCGGALRLHSLQTACAATPQPGWHCRVRMSHALAYSAPDA